MESLSLHQDEHSYQQSDAEKGRLNPGDSSDTQKDDEESKRNIGTQTALEENSRLKNSVGWKPPYTADVSGEDEIVFIRTPTDYPYRIRDDTEMAPVAAEGCMQIARNSLWNVMESFASFMRCSIRGS